MYLIIRALADLIQQIPKIHPFKIIIITHDRGVPSSRHQMIQKSNLAVEMRATNRIQKVRKLFLTQIQRTRQHG